VRQPLARGLDLTGWRHEGSGRRSGHATLTNWHQPVFGASLAAKAPKLLLEAPAVEVADACSAPTQLGHNAREAPVHAGTPVPLWNLKEVQERLAAHALETIEIDPAPHSL